MVLSLPLVPDLLTWAQKILRLAIFFTRSEHVMLSLDSGSHVQMVLLHATDHCCCLNERLWRYKDLLSGLLNDNLRLRLDEDFLSRLFDVHLRLGEDLGLRLNKHLSSWLLNNSLTEVIEHDFAQLDSLNIPVVVELELDLLGFEVDLWELDLVPELHAEIQLSVGDFPPATFKQVPGVDANLSW